MGTPLLTYPGPALFLANGVPQKTNALCLVTSRRIHSIPSGLVTFEFLNSLKQRKYFSLPLVLLLASAGLRAAVSG